MTSTLKILKLIMIAGAVYFLLVAIAHFFDLKVPGLFIYFDVNSYRYQNKIISLLAFGWSSYFYLGAEIVATDQLRYLLLPIISGTFAIFVLSIINVSNELQTMIQADALQNYWIATFALFVYLLLLIVFYIKAMREPGRR